MKAFLKQTLIGTLLAFSPVVALTQADETNKTLEGTASLEECVQYALTHQPDIQQARIDQSLADRTIKSKLADWYPQLNLNYSVQHYLQLPVTILPDLTNPSSGETREVRMGVPNSSTAALSVNQSLFNRDLLLARQTAQDIRNQSDLELKNNRIATTVNVSKAFYDVLLTREQLTIAANDISRIEESLKMAFNQYKSGLVDKIDYKRATIALNNARANEQRIQELVKAKYAVLKNSMGYPPGEMLVIQTGDQSLESSVELDTNQQVRYENRVEYQLLQTLQLLRRADIRYQKQSYLPSVSAFLNYNLVFQNQKFANLYDRSFPNSLYGLTLSYPLFQGGKRNHQIKLAELQLSRMDWDFTRLQNAIHTEFELVMAEYKANLGNTIALKENRDLAQEVYDVVDLQYKSGVKTYLDVIISQNDLQNAQFNYLNALYQLVSSKIDMDRVTGAYQ